ncbi:hypothetical protein ACFVJ8_22745 [Streptomyces yangpuensis]|uniref:hypothetical protein n=1 Tax=Streptomyces yangpuensis TaxID=1648182 RepID=UPI003643BB52
MADDDRTRTSTEQRSFLTCATAVARLLGVEESAGEPGDLRARHLAHAVRKPLLERESMPEGWFVPLMAAAVHDPDPSFCRWFVEPAVYASDCAGWQRPSSTTCGTARMPSERVLCGRGTAPMCRCARTGRRCTDPVMV